MVTTLATIKSPDLQLDTYRILKWSRAALLALVALLLAAIVLGAQVHRDAMQTVGLDAAPSIIAAQHIKSALADLDADEANILLAPPNTANAATAGVMRRRNEADEALLEATGNITYAAERPPIHTLEVTGGFYNRLAQQTEDFHDAGNPLDVRYYQAMSILTDEVLLPAADELDRANNDQLQRTYRQQSRSSNRTTALVAIAGVFTLAALFALQFFLSQRTKRTFNLPLLLATFAAILLFNFSLGALIAEQRQLKIAKEDSFESIHALWQARAIAYQAKAEQSRYLLDPGNPDHQRAFTREIGQLATLPPSLSVDTLLAQESRGEKVGNFTGYLADELDNITFAGEREAAVKTLAAFENYVKIDAGIRALETASRQLKASGQLPEAAAKHQDAVNLCVGGAPDQSGGAFQLFDDALGETLRINQEQFQHSVQSGLAAVGALGGRFSLAEAVSTLEFKALAACVLIAILIALGLAPRIKEYE
jgi:hypothetical protein